MNEFNLLLISFLIFNACTNTSNKNISSCSILITDSYQRKVILDSVPNRIISVAPAITEIMFAIGEGHRLVGRTQYCTFPLEVAKIPSIGGMENPSIEAIVKLHPDLVIASTHFRKEALLQFDQLHIPVIIEKGQDSFDGTYQLIHRIATIFKADKKADSLVVSMKTRINVVVDKAKLYSYKPKVYVVIGFGNTGDFTAGGNTFINELITMAGGRNVAFDVDGWSFSIEKLIERDPDIIIIRPGDKAVFSQTESYRHLRAVQCGKVFEVNNDLLELTGPRLVEGLEVLFKIFHPEINSK